MNATTQKPSWWRRLPGRVTALVAFISAVIGLIAGISKMLEPQDPVLAATIVALKQRTYELGWSGQLVGTSDAGFVFYMIDEIRFSGETDVILSYRRPDGPGIVKAAVGPRKLTGSWSDPDGTGEIELTFDEAYARATGWWNRGGQTDKYNAFMRRVAL